MSTADWIAIVVIVAAIVLGVVFGFGKGLKFFTSGIFGVIIAVVVCYLFLGLVLDIPFIKELLANINEWLYTKGTFGTLIADIGLGKIIIGILLFVVVQLLRIVIVKIIKGIVEIKNIAFKVINRVLGVAFFFAVFLAITLIVFHIIAWIGGETSLNFYSFLYGESGSFFRLDSLYLNNPLISIFS